MVHCETDEEDGGEVPGYSVPETTHDSDWPFTMAISVYHSGRESQNMRKYI